MNINRLLYNNKNKYKYQNYVHSLLKKKLKSIDKYLILIIYCKKNIIFLICLFTRSLTDKMYTFCSIIFYDNL